MTVYDVETVCLALMDAEKWQHSLAEAYNEGTREAYDARRRASRYRSLRLSLGLGHTLEEWLRSITPSEFKTLSEMAKEAESPSTSGGDHA